MRLNVWEVPICFWQPGRFQSFWLHQWFSVFLILRLCNIVPCAIVTPTIKLFLLLFYNCIFKTCMNGNVNIFWDRCLPNVSQSMGWKTLVYIVSLMMLILVWQWNTAVINNIDALTSKSEGKQANNLLLFCPFSWDATKRSCTHT